MKTAIITGAAGGLGRALVEAAAGRFDKLVAVVRSTPDWLVDLTTDVTEADLAKNPEQLTHRLIALPAVAQASEITFFDNAAVHELGLVADDRFPERLGRALAVNVAATAAIVHALLRLEAKLRLVHISTGAARRPIAGWGPYCVSKAGAAMLFDIIALENPAVQVFKIDPGALDTPIQDAIRTGPDVPTRSYFRELKESGALVDPRDAAARILAEVLG